MKDTEKDYVDSLKTCIEQLKTEVKEQKRKLMIDLSLLSIFWVATGIIIYCLS